MSSKGKASVECLKLKLELTFKLEDYEGLDSLGISAIRVRGRGPQESS